MIDKYFSKYESLISPKTHTVDKIIKYSKDQSYSLSNNKNDPYSQVSNLNSISNQTPTQKYLKYSSNSSSKNKKLVRSSTPSNFYLKKSSNIKPSLDLNEPSSNLNNENNYINNNNDINSDDFNNKNNNLTDKDLYISNLNPNLLLYNDPSTNNRENIYMSNQMGLEEDEFIDMNNTLLKYKKANMFLRQDVSTLKTKVKSLKNENDSLRNEIDKLKDKLQKSHLAMYQLEEVIEKLGNQKKVITNRKTLKKNNSCITKGDNNMQDSINIAQNNSTNMIINNNSSEISFKNNVNFYNNSPNKYENPDNLIEKKDFLIDSLKNENEKYKKFYDNIYLISTESKNLNTKAVNAFKQIANIFDTLNNYLKENSKPEVNIDINQEQMYLQSIKKPIEEIVNTIIEDNYLRKEEYKILLEEKNKEISSLKLQLQLNEKKIENENSQNIKNLKEEINNLKNSTLRKEDIDGINNSSNLNNKNANLVNGKENNNKNFNNSDKKNNDAGYSNYYRLKKIYKSSSCPNKKEEKEKSYNYNSNNNIYENYIDKIKNMGNYNNCKKILKNEMSSDNFNDTSGKFSLLKNTVSRTISRIEKIEYSAEKEKNSATEYL